MKKLGIVVGHTPDSPGAINNDLGINEYVLNQELAIQVKEECNRRGLDSIVIYRKNGYGKLPDDINRTGVDYCISIHHNGALDTDINGTETLVYTKCSQASMKLAYAVNREMVLFQQYRNRGIKKVDEEDGGGHVLESTSMPCILIEPYFMTNSKAVLDRNTPRLAKAIVDGYENFLKDN